MWSESFQVHNKTYTCETHATLSGEVIWTVRTEQGEHRPVAAMGIRSCEENARSAALTVVERLRYLSL